MNVLCRFRPVYSKQFLIFRSNSYYSKVVDSFPGDISLAFSYGSGIFPQKQNVDPESNMLDFIFVLRDPLTWHEANLKLNMKHYSSQMRIIGAQNINTLMTNYAAGIYFNTGINLHGRTVKYGLISEDRLIKDLNDWDTLYIAGRMHKPVNIFHSDFENSPLLYKSLNRNLFSAVITALLLLPDKFTEHELYLTITGLSYTGDFRMTVGEDRNKIANIVNCNFDHFQSLYQSTLKDLCKLPASESFLDWNDVTGSIVQDKSPFISHEHLKNLPFCLQVLVCQHFEKNAKHARDIEEIIKSLAVSSDIDDVVQTSLKSIVGPSSKNQSLKNLLTVDLTQSIKYSARKLSKMFSSFFTPPSVVKK